MWGKGYSAGEPSNNDSSQVEVESEVRWWGEKTQVPFVVSIEKIYKTVSKEITVP